LITRPVRLTAKARIKTLAGHWAPVRLHLGSSLGGVDPIATVRGSRTVLYNAYLARSARFELAGVSFRADVQAFAGLDGSIRIAARSLLRALARAKLRGP
jgi:hypothetical protein